MWGNLIPREWRKVSAVCGLWYGEKANTQAIAQHLGLHEAEVWNILGRHGARWRKRYLEPQGRMARWLWRNG